MLIRKGTHSLKRLTSVQGCHYQKMEHLYRPTRCVPPEKPFVHGVCNMVL